MIPSENPKLLTDQNLYALCKTYGARTLEWRRKFTGLLPEVFKRKLHEKKGFESIFVFAKKLAGLSEEQVRLTLNLEKKFETVPLLKNLLINGEVSINKLARVASVAKAENEEFLAENLKILSQSAVETLVRDEKWAEKNKKNSEHHENQNGLLEPQIGAKSLRAQTFMKSILGKSTSSKTHAFESLNLSPEVHQKLLELQQKGLDLNQLLLEFLQNAKRKSLKRKEKSVEKFCKGKRKKAKK